MGAELRIESDDVVRLATELAELRGVSVPDAVAAALRQDLEWQRGKAERAQRILDAAAAVRATMRLPLPTSDHSWLYDENGFPA